MIKRVLLSTILAGALATSAQAWTAWNTFKHEQYEAGRVIDFNDDRLITTSEGQSYSLFFALVAGDKAAFESLLTWTETHLSKGNLTKTLPAWLWGSQPQPGVIDSNNAVDSDMWIAYCLLEAARLWNRPDYHQKAMALLDLLKTQVREIPSIGKVLLPGQYGFDKEDAVTLNPSYYPLFLLRRFAVEDAYWNPVFDGCLRATLRSAPNGFAPDWVTFAKDGSIASSTDPVGSYNAIRVYLWAGMMAKSDPIRARLKAYFAPMIRLTESMNVPAEKVDVIGARANGPGSLGFAACLLPLMDDNRQAALIRTYLNASPIVKENYYRNVLTLFGMGFDQREFAFDRNGFVYFPKSMKKEGR